MARATKGTLILVEAYPGDVQLYLAHSGGIHDRLKGTSGVLRQLFGSSKSWEALAQSRVAWLWARESSASQGKRRDGTEHAKRCFLPTESPPGPKSCKERTIFGGTEHVETPIATPTPDTDCPCAGSQV